MKKNYATDWTNAVGPCCWLFCLAICSSVAWLFGQPIYIWLYGFWTPIQSYVWGWATGSFWWLLGEGHCVTEMLICPSLCPSVCLSVYSQTLSIQLWHVGNKSFFLWQLIYSALRVPKCLMWLEPIKTKQNKKNLAIWGKRWHEIKSIGVCFSWCVFMSINLALIE